MLGVTTRNTLAKQLKRLGIFEILRPRRCHVYGVGAAKTGTHSIAHLFGPPFHSAHETLDFGSMDWIVAAHEGTKSRREILRYLRRRDRELYLEVESSHPLAVFTSHLVEAFPRAKFILTVREPLSWLDSIINQHLNVRWVPETTRARSQFFIKLRDLYHGTAEQGHAEQESALKDRGLYTLDGYLGYWAAHNRSVLKAVPEERLLVVETRRISHEIDRIAQFVEVPAEHLNAERSHAFVAPERHNVLAELDQDRLHAKVEEHCREVLDVLARRGVPLEAAGRR